ncbi:MAG: DUF6382 domain-containing protein [Lachnospiraceae bacterium]
MNKSYMVICDESYYNGFELMMMKNQRFEHLLPAQVLITGGKMQYWYEITGAVSMDAYLQDHTITLDYLRDFFWSLKKALVEMEPYLLPEDGVSFRFEEIFYHVNQKSIYFCYKPFEKKELRKGIKQFMEVFLQKMDHSNKEKSRICYEVYDICTNPVFSLDELMTVLESYHPGIEAALPNITEQTRTDRESSYIAPTIIEAREKKNRACPKIFGSLKSKLSSELLGFYERSIRQEKKSCNYIAYPQDLAEEEKQKRESSRKTVLLGSMDPMIKGELKYEGGGYEENLLIDKEVFFVGSSKKDCDGVISGHTVSHMHAKITREKEDYYIEDLNSKNGTTHNECVLNYKEKIQLQKNDCILFADIPYRFV